MDDPNRQGITKSRAFGAGLAAAASRLLGGAASAPAPRPAAPSQAPTATSHEAARPRLPDIVERAGLALAVVQDGRFAMVTEALASMLGADKNDLLGQPYVLVLPNPEDPLANTLAQGGLDREIDLARLDGSILLARLRTRAWAPGDASRGTIWLLEEPAEASKPTGAAGGRGAHYDAMTGLINRSAFERLVDARIGIADTAPFSVMLIDLDQFGMINESAGEAAGDALIKGLAASFRSCLRRADTVARIGDDEFAVMLPGCPAPKAMELADMLRQAVCDHKMRWDGRLLSVGASIGVVMAAGSHADTTELMADAIAACQDAKRRGRNRVSSGADQGPATVPFEYEPS